MPPKRPTSQTAAAPTATAENIANIERMIAAQASVLAQKAPKQLQDMKTLLRELKAGKPPSAASEQMMRSLVIWQLDSKREDYSARLAARGSRAHACHSEGASCTRRHSCARRGEEGDDRSEPAGDASGRDGVRASEGCARGRDGRRASGGRRP